MSRTYVSVGECEEHFATTLKSRSLALSGMKACGGCGQERDAVEGFHRNQSKCKDCQAASKAEWVGLNKERDRARHDEWVAANRERTRATRRRWYVKDRGDTWLRHRYGLSLAEYEALLAEQGGGCAICHEPPGEKRLSVDHCHGSLTIRGILCSQCNRGLGEFGDDADRLERAAAYLRRGPIHPGKSAPEGA